MDYLHEVQSRLGAEKSQLTVLDRKIVELKAYDEVLYHMADMQIDIDLDDGMGRICRH